MTEPSHILLNDQDNVVVAIQRIAKGEPLAESSEQAPREQAAIIAKSAIPKGHKMARSAIAKGEVVRKYGQIIGFATETIAPGDHVHVHNCAMGEIARDYAFCRDAMTPEPASGAAIRTFDGYRRPGGKTGTRNYIGVLTSVNCAASAARFIADAANRSGLLEAYPNIDGVVALVHGTGCGMASGTEGYEIFRRTQWGYASHPNFAAVLMVGLGCEVFQIAQMKQHYGIDESDRFRSFTLQDEGGTRKTIDQGLETIRDMLPAANACRRETVPASELKVALQCGGSDGYSGITANVALGHATDLLVAQGGTGILAETPEIFGAEHLLTARAASREIGEKLIERIAWWQDYTARNSMEMNNNPSPGNKAGGLTTILEKSLGAAAKGGTTALAGVYEYAQEVRARGFVFMDSPGYDPVSVTGQVASGANLVCFTTGRGSCFGYKPAPSLKLATNSDMYNRMEPDMDINCGDVLEGVSVAQKGEEIFNVMLEAASGRKTKSEALGYGDNEFVPWHIGAVM